MHSHTPSLVNIDNLGFKRKQLYTCVEYQESLKIHVNVANEGRVIHSMR